jgi:polyisoprenoid-binding protein YceI
MDKNGVQNVRAKGKLTIHGIVKTIDVPGTFEVKENTLNIKSKFKILMADYDIKIPAVLWKNISEEVEVTIDLTYKP